MSDILPYQQLIKETGNHFKVQEFNVQGPVTHVDIGHFEEVLRFRQWHGFSTKVSSSWRKQGTGYHPKGLATDIVLFHTWNETPLDAMHLWNLATAWSFTGVGLYFDWEFTNTKGDKVRTPGLHVDSGNLANRPLRWFCKEYEVEGKAKNHYYYQDFKTGQFYNSIRDEAFSLKEAIVQFNS